MQFVCVHPHLWLESLTLCCELFFVEGLSSSWRVLYRRFQCMCSLFVGDNLVKNTPSPPPPPPLQSSEIGNLQGVKLMTDLVFDRRKLHHCCLHSRSHHHTHHLRQHRSHSYTQTHSLCSLMANNKYQVLVQPHSMK